MHVCVSTSAVGYYKPRRISPCSHLLKILSLKLDNALILFFEVLFLVVVKSCNGLLFMKSTSGLLSTSRDRSSLVMTYIG
jgi:hypothetical protein